MKQSLCIIVSLIGTLVLVNSIASRQLEKEQAKPATVKTAPAERELHLTVCRTLLGPQRCPQI